MNMTKPSLDDARRMFGRSTSRRVPEKFHEMGPENGSSPWAKKGPGLRERRSRRSCPGQTREVNDATGAGDAFGPATPRRCSTGSRRTGCVFAREIAEMNWTTKGPLPTDVDRKENLRTARRSGEMGSSERRGKAPRAASRNHKGGAPHARRVPEPAGQLRP